MRPLKNIHLGRNAAINFINKAVSMFLPLVSLLIVTRRIGVERFGTAVYCNSIVTYFLLLASLGIGSYAVRECAPIRGDEKQVGNRINQLFSFNLITSCSAYLLFVAFMMVVPMSKMQKSILWILGFKILFAALDLDWLYKTFEDYLFVAICRILTEALSLFALAMLVHGPEDVWIYSIVTVAAVVFTGVLELAGASRYVRLRWTSKIPIKRIIVPILTLFASSAMIAIYINSDLTMLGAMRSDYEVGIYRVAGKIYTILRELINAICIVSVPRIAFYLQQKDMEAYHNLSRKLFQGIILAVAPAVTGIFLVSDTVIPLVMGEEYAASASALKVLCLALFFATTNNLLINVILLNFKRDLIIFRATALSVAVNVLLNLAVIPLWGIYAAAATTVLSEIVVFVCAVVACRDVFSFQGALRPAALAALGCLIITLICKGTAMLGLPPLARLVGQIGFSAVFYLGLLLCFWKRIGNE